MSKGYYAIKTIVFHNQQKKQEFLLNNPDYVSITRKILREAIKYEEEKELTCANCEEKHKFGKIQWSKLK